MSLQERLLQDMKAAMKDKEAGKTRLTVIRMVRSAIKNKEIEVGREVSEEETLEVLVRELKMRKDSLPEFEASGRDNLVAKLKEEIEILMAYLPEQLSMEEIVSLVQGVIAEVGAQGPRDLGKVMGKVIPATKGKADGKVVNQVVRRLLEEIQA